MAAAAAWFAAVWAAGLWLGAPAWMAAPLLFAAVYVVWPLLLPAEASLEEAGVRLTSPFGALRLPWERIAGYSLGRGGRAVFLHRTGGLWGRLGGSVTLFLPADRALAEAIRGTLAERAQGRRPAAGEEA
jgi:hypothetical protein